MSDDGSPISLDQRRAVRESAAKPLAPVIPAVIVSYGVELGAPLAELEIEDATTGARFRFRVPARQALELARGWLSAPFYERLKQHADEPPGGDGAGDA